MRLASNPPPFGIMEYNMNSECCPSALIQIKLTDPCAMMLRASADPKPTLCGPAHMPSGFGTVFERAQGGPRPTRLWSVRRGAADAPTAFNSCGRPIRNEARSCRVLRSGATAEIYELSDRAALFRGNRFRYLHRMAQGHSAKGQRVTLPARPVLPGDVLVLRLPHLPRSP